MSGIVRGIETQHEHAAQMIARDTRPLGVRFSEFLCNPIANFTIFASAICFSWLYSCYADLLFLTCGAIAAFALTRKNALPFKMPKSSKELDHNDLVPGTEKPSTAGGIAFFGNDRKTKEELWFSNSDMRTHVLIFGSTGSGKTEALVSLTYNSLIQGSGFIYVDGKGDNSLYAKVFSMVRKMGREDDLLAVNFMTGARDIIGPQSNRLSNTLNPFANGSSSMLSQLVVSLMDASSGDASGDMWKGRAINFVESLMKILTPMRDAGHILLDANSIRDYFLLEKLEQIVVHKKFPVGRNGHTVDISGYPEKILDPLRNYVYNLPGYNPAKVGKQAGEVLEQHGFITMQLTRVFGSLADTYGHILRTNLAEVDLKDVVLNRRILVVLLPALEKSPEELSNLGKIIIASLKAMMAAGLGDAIEGDYRDVIMRKPTNSPSPFLCVMDEYGYYAVKGFAVVAAQARSLGFSAVFAGQDLPAFQKASKEEAASIGANCNIKICMKLEDPQETWEYFNKTAGESYVTNVSSFQMQPNSFTMNYLDNRSTSVDRRQRIELLDLKDQREGQAHIFFQSKIVRAEMFYANPKPTKMIGVNQLLKVEPPPDTLIENIFQRLNKFNAVFKNYNFKMPSTVANEDISLMEHCLQESYGLAPIERGLTALATILEHELAAHRTLSQEIPVLNEDIERMSIFTPIPVNTTIEKIIGKDYAKQFTIPLVKYETLNTDLLNIERLSGKEQNSAKDTTQKLIQDILDRTSFPPLDGTVIPVSKEQLLADVNKFIMKMGGSPYTPDLSPKPIPGSMPEINIDTKPQTEPKNHRLPDLPNLPNLPNLLDLPDLKELEKQLKDLDLGNLDFNNMPPIKNPDELNKIQNLLDDDYKDESDTNPEDDKE